MQSLIHSNDTTLLQDLVLKAGQTETKTHTFLHSHIKCIHSHIKCIHSYIKCIHSYIKCIHSYIKCIHSYIKCIHSYIKWIHSYIKYIWTRLRRPVTITLCPWMIIVVVLWRWPPCFDYHPPSLSFCVVRVLHFSSSVCFSRASFYSRSLKISSTGMESVQTRTVSP